MLVHDVEIIPVHTCIRSRDYTVFAMVMQLTTAALYCDIVIYAYDVSLRASKEKEQQLKSQLDKVQQESQDIREQLSKLEDENFGLQKERLVLKHANELQQEELKTLQQTG